MKNVKVALVHYWLINMRGGEKVLETLCEMFPEADIYTHVYDPTNISQTIRSHQVKTTFINKLPRSKKYYQKYLPFMPMALEQLDLTAYDLVISSESGPAKGIIVAPHAKHICYCHSPMRYIWDMYHAYRQDAGFITRLMMPLVAHYLRMWDVSSATRVDQFIANSSFVQQRIMRYYRREAEVVFPPVDTGEFQASDSCEDFYLMVGQLVKYKKADLAVEAFNLSGKRLVIVGEGELLESLRRLAKPNVDILGWQPFDKIKKYYAQCKALIFPGVEDFGMVPVEVMASGRPVIAYAKGGALDSVLEGQTGTFFYEQSVVALNEAVEAYENQQSSFCSSEIVKHASQFDKQHFKENLWKIIHTLDVGIH